MAGLHVYRSNRLEALVALVAQRLRDAGEDPFAPVEVVVGSRGMERHLRHALAEHLGICAHVDFPFPAAALDALVAEPSTGPDPWGPGALTWALLEVLPTVAAADESGPLRRYLAPSAAGPAVDARTWGLARRIADTFDRYVTFRPELAIAWSAGAAPDVPDGQRWQPALWRAVREHLGAPPHRAERLAAFADRAPAEGAQPPLHVFGLSSLAGSWLQALGHVARGRPVELYLLCPSDIYWSDLGRRLGELPDLADAPRDEVGERLRTGRDDDRLGDAGHPLLVSWGRTGRDLQILLESLPDGVEEGRTDLFIDPEHGAPVGTALHRLQADILRAIHPASSEDFADRRLDPLDRSVQLHACHGPTRQVEVLRTVILELLDADPTLRPRDIVVMTPDIDLYAPLIGAVFEEGQAAPGPDGWAPAGSPRLPWELADLAVRRLNPVADALIRVLEMVDGRAAASEVLDLLALAPVAERFGILPDDVPTLRGWVIDSGVRWGAHGGHRAAHDQPRDDQNTWRSGLDRLLLGVTMADDGRLPAGIRPLDAVEGAGARLLGRLAELGATLFAWLDDLREPRPLAAWVERLDAAVDALTRTSGQAAWLTRRVRDEILAMGREAEASGSARPIGVDALRAALSGRFEVASAARHGAGGAITFCGMVPERAVPYRVVALLGMDEGSFPRTGGRAAFDLLHRAPRVGDRDVRDEDRYLLLEAVLSARDHLLVTWTGRDVRTNEARPPAVPVSELCDALDATWPADPDPDAPRPSAALTRHHTLQAFDRRNFAASDDAQPWSYDLRLLDGVAAALGPRSDPTPFLSLDLDGAAAPGAVDELPLDEVIRFWRHPVRAFLQQELRLWLPTEGDEDVPDREPIELGWLDRKRLLDELLAARAEGRDPGAIRGALRASGALPLGGAGDVLFDALHRLAGEMHEAAAAICAWAGDEVRAVDLDVARGGDRLVGRLAGCTDRALVGFAYGQERPGDLLEAWIRLLARRAHDPAAPRRAVLIFGQLDGRGAPVVAPIGLELTDDTAALDLLVAGRREGLARPLPYFPKASHELAKVLCKKLPREALEPDRLADADETTARAVEDAVAAARSAWLGGFDPGEADERYNRHAFGSELPWLDADGAVRPRFVALAAQVWGPVLDARRTKKTMAGWEAP